MAMWRVVQRVITDHCCNWHDISLSLKRSIQNRFPASREYHTTPRKDQESISSKIYPFLTSNISAPENSSKALLDLAYSESR